MQKNMKKSKKIAAALFSFLLLFHYPSIHLLQFCLSIFILKCKNIIVQKKSGAGFSSNQNLVTGLHQKSIICMMHEHVFGKTFEKSKERKDWLKTNIAKRASYRGKKEVTAVQHSILVIQMGCLFFIDH